MKNNVIKVMLSITIVGMLITGCKKSDTQTISQETTGREESVHSLQDSSVEVESGLETEASDEFAKTSIVFYAREIEDKYWPDVEKGIEKAKKELDLKEVNVIRGKEGESFSAILEEESKKESRSFSFFLNDPQSEEEALQNAYQLGVPLIGVGLQVPESLKNTLSANVAADAYSCGQLAATNSYALLKDRLEEAESTLRIAVICEDTQSALIHARTSGYVDKMVELIGASKTAVEGHENYQKIVEEPTVILEVIAPTLPEEPETDTTESESEQTASIEDDSSANEETEGLEGDTHSDAENTYDAERMNPSVQEVLGKNDLIAIFATSEEAANALLQINENMNRLGSEAVIGVGFDAGTVQMEAIRNGYLAGAVSRNYEQLGYKAIIMAAKASKGEAVRSEDTGEIWYNSDNMDTTELESYLYE
jgi:ribose transport system substrate-binding protein